MVMCDLYRKYSEKIIIDELFHLTIYSRSVHIESTTRPKDLNYNYRMILKIMYAVSDRKSYHKVGEEATDKVKGKLTILYIFIYQ